MVNYEPQTTDSEPGGKGLGGSSGAIGADAASQRLLLSKVECRFNHAARDQSWTATVGA